MSDNIIGQYRYGALILRDSIFTDHQPSTKSRLANIFSLRLTAAIYVINCEMYSMKHENACRNHDLFVYMHVCYNNMHRRNSCCAVIYNINECLYIIMCRPKTYPSHVMKRNKGGGGMSKYLF